MPDFGAFAGEMFPAEGRANVAAQLQQGDPSTPAAGTMALFNEWLKWRMGVAKEQAEDPTSMPFAVGALESNTARVLRGLARIPVRPEARVVSPSQAQTPARPTLESLLPGGLLEEYRRVGSRSLSRADVQKSAKDIQKQFKTVEQLEPEFELGRPSGEHWYTGAYRQIQNEIAKLAQAAPKADINVEKDPVLLSKMIAATSPRAEPFWNVDNALRAYGDFLKSGRKEKFGFPRQTFGGYAGNLRAAIKGEPFSDVSMKASNFLLDILGSEQDPTIDRWAANALLGKPSTKANLTSTEYQVSADRMKELARIFGVTPVRFQAALWTGTKMLRDERIKGLLDLNLSPQQAVPSLREVIAHQVGKLRQQVTFDPKIITPGMALGAILLERAREEGQQSEGASGRE